MRIALKRLSKSDLTLFEAQFRKDPTNKQKGININKNPVDSVLFPGLEDHLLRIAAPEKARRAETKAAGQAFKKREYQGVPVKLTITGPAAAPPVQWQRHINLNQKNLRLNGKLIPSPEDHRDRFDDLEKGDIAIMGFEGDLIPTSLHITILSPRNPADHQLWSNAERFIGKAAGGMRVCHPDDFASLMHGVPSDQPGTALLRTPLSESDVVEAVLGDPIAQAKLRAPGMSRVVTPDELELAQRRAAEIGRKGEFLVNRWLELNHAAGKIAAFVWASAANAVAPYDFVVTQMSGVNERHDVKATTGSLSNRFFMSMAELNECAGSEEPYYVIRVSQAEGPAPKMVRSSDLRSLARSILAALSHLPKGIQPDGLSVDPTVITWGEENVLPAHPDYKPA